MAGLFLDDVNEAHPSTALQWRSWPIRDDAFRASLVLVWLFVAALLVRWVTGQYDLALLAVGVLAAALWRFFVPVTFELGDAGIAQSALGRRRRIPWSAIRRYEVFPSGVLLLPDAGRHALGAFQGLYLPWGGHRNRVLACMRYRLTPSAEG